MKVIAALDKHRGIGKDNQLPWRLKEDMAFFKKTTMEAPEGTVNVVVMGRNTWESIPEKFRPLPKRINMVLTHDPDAEFEGAVAVNSFNDIGKALSAVTVATVGEIFIIGGAAVYEEALQHPDCSCLYLTQVMTEADCDVFFPEYEDSFKRGGAADTETSGDLQFRFETWVRR